MTTESGKANGQPEDGGELVTVTVRLAKEVYASLASVAHDEGHSIEEQARRGIEEMLRERKRRPLFD